MSKDPQLITSPAGSPAWLVTEYAEVKKLLSDERLSRFAHPDPDHAPRFTNSDIIGSPLHSLDMEQQRTVAIQTFIEPFFKPRQISRLELLVRAEVDRAFAAMREAGSPGDVRDLVAYSIPAAVISALIGIPPALRELARDLAHNASNILDPEIAAAARAELDHMCLCLLEHIPSDAPAETMLTRIGRLVGADLTDEVRREFARMLTGVQIAGQMNATTAIERGLIVLLTNESARTRLAQNTALVDDAVEEILRIAHPIYPRSSGVPRFALADLDIGAVTVRRGELMVLDFEQANQDPAEFGCPATFDIERRPNKHLTFGYGIHFCVGARLARIELRSVIARIFDEFPGLRLAAGQEWTRFSELLSGGVRSLVVEW
ncbi:cytochrome P450 [Nocardia sp. NPDC050710]|uniref:cytochrome P450 n=1 Tax=Nocardia sp. NPDC050710 TaxID=3157220 RepID=UPI0033C9B1BD